MWIQSGRGRVVKILLKSQSISARHAASSAATAATAPPAKDYDTLPQVTGGLPIVGSFSKIGDKPYGLEKAVYNIIKYKKSHDPENIGMLRFTSHLINREGDGRLLFVFDPKDVETTYRNESIHPSRGSGAFAALSKWRKTRPDLFPVTNGVLFEEGKKWHEIRSLINPDMMRPKSAFFYIDQLQEVCEDFVTLCKQRRDSSTLIAPGDHLDDYHKFGIEAISVVALNTRLNCLVSGDSSPRSSENQAMMDAAKTAVDMAGEMMNGMPWHILFGKLDPKYRKLANNADIVGDFVRARLDEVIERIKNKPVDDDSETSVLEKLIAKAGPESTIPFVTAFDMVVAGIDTTGNSSAFLMYNLATNPEAQERLREEIRTCTGGEKHVTKKALADMRYLRACIKESMRIMPVILFSVRLLPNDVVIGGYKVPKNTMVCWSPQVMAMDEKIFKDPMSFKPERWYRENKRDIHPFASLPFSHGPRGCVGRRFAELEMQLLTIKMMQNFRLEWPAENGKVDTQWKFLNRPDKPLKLKYLDV